MFFCIIELRYRLLSFVTASLCHYKAKYSIELVFCQQTVPCNTIVKITSGQNFWANVTLFGKLDQFNWKSKRRSRSEIIRATNYYINNLRGSFFYFYSKSVQSLQVDLFSCEKHLCDLICTLSELLNAEIVGFPSSSPYSYFLFIGRETKGAMKRDLMKQKH